MVPSKTNLLTWVLPCSIAVLRLSAMSAVLGAVGCSGSGASNDPGMPVGPDGGTPEDASIGTDASGGLCASDVDCAGGLHCDPVVKTCVACVFDGDCKGANQRCTQGTCSEIVPCRSSFDCVGMPGGKGICDKATGQCVACTSVADCPANADCVHQ